MKVLLLFFRLLFFFAVPTFLIYIGKDATFFSWLKSSLFAFNYLDIERTQLCAFIAGTIWVGLYNPLYFELSRWKFNRKSIKYIELLNYNKETYLKLMKKDVGIERSNIQVRLFFPKKDVISFVKKFISGKSILAMKHVQGITDEFSSNNVAFTVSKHHQEGMVGRSFYKKELMLDFDLVSQTKYILTDKQKILVGNTKFCGTIPIFMNSSDKVKAVLSIDSDEKFTLENTQIDKLSTHMRYIAAFTDKYIN